MESVKIIEKMQKLVGKKVPVLVDRLDGKVTNITYEREWKEGGTTPVTNKKGEVVDYKENYKIVKLTDSEAKKLDEFVKDQIKAD